MAAILKVWRHIRNPIPSIDEYLLEEQSCKISSGSDLKRRSLGLYLNKSPQVNEKKKNNKMSSDMRSVPDLKISKSS